MSMKSPSVRVGRNRRRIFLYLPFLVIGALLFLASTETAPVINSAYLAGVTLLLAGAAGFILETGHTK
ncbi:hypothetical protein [Arthrobacter sp. NicSoilC5]|uniref:hypothetical protein n=1 Tax=Arthrobacter sp. NicSoilC5 TaxID=2831000 RepID=UPI001CC784D9|nr:hypothetical protein [Arthrobacter sp. NicSoilC5]BCW78983.1 hypothetical protein NicSoilC5_10020 [Arthrobacter sp. NicSoilC5]